jgi:hypothetical protein
MHGFRTAALCLSMAFALPNSVLAAPFPQLLPDAGSFELTVREDPGISLPLGPACGGEAALSLACRAFIVTLRNVGTRTVHLSRIACQEPVVNFEMKEPNSSSGWMPISQISRTKCTPWSYENLHLRPGEATEYSTRLVSQNRPAAFFAPVAPRSYTIHVRWLLWGCTEDPEGTDCLDPLQIMKANSWGGPTTGQVEIQTPVEVISKEILVGSPALRDLGGLKLGFEVSLAPEPRASEMRKHFGALCATDTETSIECTVFHYAIRNLGDRPIRNGRFTCSDYSIMPEYRTDDGDWKQLQSRLMACTANIFFQTPILPGKAAEGDFTLRGLAPQFDTSPLYPAGRCEFRFRFQSNACFASPDGSFCIQSPKEQIVAISNVVAIQATAFNASGSSRVKMF